MTNRQIRAEIANGGYSYLVVLAARNLEIDSRNALVSATQHAARSPSPFGPEDDAEYLAKLASALDAAVVLNRECEAGGMKDAKTAEQFRIRALIGD